MGIIFISLTCSTTESFVEETRAYRSISMSAVTVFSEMCSFEVQLYAALRRKGFIREEVTLNMLNVLCIGRSMNYHNEM